MPAEARCADVREVTCPGNGYEDEEQVEPRVAANVDRGAPPARRVRDGDLRRESRLFSAASSRARGRREKTHLWLEQVLAQERPRRRPLDTRPDLCAIRVHRRPLRRCRRSPRWLGPALPHVLLLLLWDGLASSRSSSSWTARPSRIRYRPRLLDNRTLHDVALPILLADPLQGWPEFSEREGSSVRRRGRGRGRWVGRCERVLVVVHCES